MEYSTATVDAVKRLKALNERSQKDPGKCFWFPRLCQAEHKVVKCVLADFQLKIRGGLGGDILPIE